MKKLYLLLGILIGQLFFSCTSDDNSNTQETDSEEQEENDLLLTRIVSRSIESGTENRILFENGRRHLDSLNFGVGTWSYSNGLLENYTIVDFDGNIIQSTDFEFDNQGRLINFKVTDDQGNLNTNSIVYSDSGITATRTDDQGEEFQIDYMINELGQIISNGIVEVTFENGNVSSATFFNSSTTNYEHNTELEVAPAYRSRYSINGSINNFIIWTGNFEDRTDVYDKNYLIKEIREDILTYDFRFEDDLPTSRSISIADDNQEQPELIIQEQFFYE